MNITRNLSQNKIFRKNIQNLPIFAASKRMSNIINRNERSAIAQKYEMK